MVQEQNAVKKLCIVNTAVITISTASVAVAGEQSKLENPSVLEKFHDHVNEIFNKAKSEVAKGKNKEAPWFLRYQMYEESVKYVMGKAIDDCVANRNEFKDQPAGAIITFEGTNYLNYARQNWNAVMLYNYVNDAIKGDGSRSMVEILDSCVNRILGYYRTHNAIVDGDIKNNVITAARDIAKYIKALQLDYMVPNEGLGEHSKK